MVKDTWPCYHRLCNTVRGISFEEYSISITGNLESISSSQIKRMQAANAITEFNLLQTSTTNSSLPVDSSTIHPAVLPLLQQFDFLCHETQHVPPKRDTDHTIHLTPNTDPIIVRPYRYPHFQKKETERLVSDMLSLGLIRHSTSAFSSLSLLVKKGWHLAFLTLTIESSINK